MKIRPMQHQDVNECYRLMKELAEFEHYIDIFAITPEIVIEKGLGKDPADFQCLVAEVDQEIAGMLVYYILPYTAHNKPEIFIKELYIDKHFRGQGVGKALMTYLYEIGKKEGCHQIKWTVADWNTPAQKFYKDLGATENSEWLNYGWQIKD